MTMNNEIEEKEGLEIVEEDAFDLKESNNENINDDNFILPNIELDDTDDLDFISNDPDINKEILLFYEENKEAVNLIGGLDFLTPIIDLPEENFEELEPELLAIFTTIINEPAAENQFRNAILTQGITTEQLEEDFNKAIDTIDNITFFSEAKKDFLKEVCIVTVNKFRYIIGNLQEAVHIPCRLEKNVKLPTYAHETDAGLDIYAREEITIAPGETKIIGTGIKVAIPEGYAILIQPRSGQSAKTKLRIANTPGLIDSGYRDEIGVIIENIEPPFKNIDYEFDENGEIHIKSILHGQSYTITEGQRFAQMRLVQVPKAEFIQMESVGEIGEDRGGGFGSTDIVGEN